MENFVREDEARQLIAPIERDLERVIRLSFELWQNEAALLYPTATKHGVKWFLHQGIVRFAKELFGPRDGCKIIESSDNRFLLVYAGLVLRFKYVDGRFRASTFKTPAAVRVESSDDAGDLGLPPGRRLTVGFGFDRSETSIEGIYLICYVKRRTPAWHFELNGAERQLSIFRPAAKATPESKRRVTGKKAAEAEKVVNLESRRRDKE